MSIFVDVNSLPKPYPQVIKVDGQCYQIVGGTEQAADTFAIEGEFEDCDDCKADVSYSSSSSQGQSSSSSSEGISSSSSQGFSSSSSSLSAENSSSSSQSAVANACTGNDCSGTNEPNLILKIGDPSGTYAGGSITWCGKTWTQAQINANNFEQCACPTAYGKGDYATQTFSYQVRHYWNHNVGGGDSLQLAREATNALTAIVRNRIKFRNELGINERYGFTTFFPDTLFNKNTPATFTAVDAVAAPNSTNYALTNDFFGWNVTVGGVEYSIVKGINWP